MTITLDIAAIIAALGWPIVVLIAIIALRKRLPELLAKLSGRITKLSLGDFLSIELAEAKAFAPEWTGTQNAVDLRNTAVATQINDSYVGNFINQLREKVHADYAVVNLGTGREWLTSRLFIMAVIFARVKGIKAFVFYETAGEVRKRFVGWAEPERIRWALAKKFPRLEEAYANAYANIIGNKQAFIVANDGRMGYQYSTDDPGSGIQLMTAFVQNIQEMLPPGAVPPDSDEYYLVDAATNTYEYATWISGESLEDLLGDACVTSSVRSADLRAGKKADHIRQLLSLPGRFAAVTEDDGRFSYVVDRVSILEQVARKLAEASAE